MSTQRRRVLEGDGGVTTITDDGIYIEGLNNKFYTVDDWKSGNDANSIVVSSGDVKFRMALTEASDTMAICGSYYDTYEDYMERWDWSSGHYDYDGAGNTAKMLKVQPSTDYAAGYCNAFVFPDGKTKGYLPSFGQLYRARRNKDAIEAALSKCGGTAMCTKKDYYWTSSFNSESDGLHYFLVLDWKYDGVSDYSAFYGFHVRPFADIS